MAKKLSDKTSLIAAVVLTAIMCVLRSVQLCSLVEYPSGFFTTDGEFMQTFICAAAIVMMIITCCFAAHDIKDRRKKDIYDMSRGAASVFGFMLILIGASVFISLLSVFSMKDMLMIISLLVSCVSYMVLGVMVFATAKITPPATVCAVLLIAAQLPRMVVYYLDNPLLTKVPQKLMMMGFYIFYELFLFCIGKLFSGGGSRFTKMYAISFGYMTAIIGFGTVVSNYVLMGANGDNWLTLTDTPDIEYLAVTIGAAFMSSTILLGCKAKAAAEDTEVSTEKTEAANDIESNGTVENTGSEESSDPTEENTDGE